MLLQAGPSFDAKWEKIFVDDVELSANLLLLPDANNKEIVNLHRSAVYYYIPERPTLQKNNDGIPLFSLNLILERQPHPYEININKLIKKGILNFSIQLDLPSHLITKIQELHSLDYRPLFIREAIFDLIIENNGVRKNIASVNTSGLEVTALFNVELNRTETLNIISAIEGSKSNIKLQGRIFYRVIELKITHIHGLWKSIHNFLNSRIVSKKISKSKLNRYFDEMIQSKIISISVISSLGIKKNITEDDKKKFFDIFLRKSSIILKKNMSEQENNQETYILQDVDKGSFEFNYKQIWRIVHTKSLILDTALECVVGKIIDFLGPDKFIHLMSPSSSNIIGMEITPKRIITPLDSVESRELKKPQKIPVILTKCNSKPLPLYLKPSPVIIDAQSIGSNDRISLVSSKLNKIKTWKFNEFIFNTKESSKIKSLPIITDSSTSIWRDRINSRKYWYAPSFEIIEPKPGESPTNNSFSFIFERIGIAESGEPILNCTIQFKLLKTINSEVKSDIQRIGESNVYEVKLNNLSAFLDIPFIDQKDGIIKHHRFNSIISTASDDIVANIILSNKWVNICYGTLGWPNFQKEKARLCITYSYEAYVPIKDENIEIIHGEKNAFTPISNSQSENQKFINTPYFDAVKNIYRYPNGEFHFKSEPFLKKSIQEREISVVNKRVKPLLAKPVLYQHISVAKPLLKLPANNFEITTVTKYAKQTFIHQEFLDAFFDCKEFGMLYSEKLGDSIIPIGCRDAFRLGEIFYSLYEEISNLSHPLYRVYRSLQQPGRFLLVPTTYRITRYHPSESDRAYLPIIFVFSSLDSEDPENNHVIFDMILQPDIPRHVLQELKVNLTSYSHQPVIEYPTQIMNESEYVWAIDSSINIRPNVERDSNFLHVTLTTDLTGALLTRDLLEKSGIFGSIQFNLSDGSFLRSDLALELQNIIGPWNTDPFEVSQTHEGIHILNKIEQTITISDLNIYYNSGSVEQIPVEINLAPGMSEIIPINQLNINEIYPVYSILTSKKDNIELEEIRSFIEDVRINLIFLDQINYANHNLKDLEVKCKIKNWEDHLYLVNLGENSKTGTIDIILPITKYLENLVIQFQVTKNFNSGENSITSWFDWELESQGNIIGLVWEMISD